MPLRLNTVKWGSGTPTVFLLHGLGDGAFVWNHIAPALAADDTVMAVELRGHGDSPRDPEARYDPETHAEDVFAMILDFTGGGSVSLIGHSLGAIVAVHVAFLARKQIRGLALVDGGPGMDPATSRHIRHQFLTQPWFYASVDSFAVELQRRYPLSNPQLLQGMAQHALRRLGQEGYELKCDRRLVSATGVLNSELLLWRKLESFNGPVLVIRGAGSAVLTRRAAERMANELPDCRLHTVPGAGHAVMLDNPDDFLLATRTFLSEVACNSCTRRGARTPV
jgi:pimeloyl-ACP methyl ester carboxylesterase